MGFSLVYHYTAGKADWLAFGLPMEGENSAIPKTGDVMRRDIPTCQLNERVVNVHERCRKNGWKFCIVVNEANVVLGRVRGKSWEADAETSVEDVMENGPTTFRPDTFLEPLTKRMHDKKVGTAIITRSDGALLGVLYRKDADERLKEPTQTGDKQSVE